jgi:flavodoxin/NAD-dependent dihydropyrimidine dehydrogenase PreA subunit
MVFYFSGTGNSFWVAKEIADTFEDSVISIADELNNPDNDFNYNLKNEEKVFFVFPVHSWGPAVLVKDFVKKIKFVNYNYNKIYCICVCGDNCGYTSKIMDKILRKNGITITKSYSVQMPNNYILMSGFGVDNENVKNNKLKQAPELIDKITADIKNSGNLEMYTIGDKPFLKSNIVYPLFKKFAIKRNKFHITKACISCGLCEKICPTKTIKLVNQKPQWGKKCVQCTACIHRCPAKAIEYGNITQTQGRYVNPVYHSGKK